MNQKERAYLGPLFFASNKHSPPHPNILAIFSRINFRFQKISHTFAVRKQKDVFRILILGYG